MLSLALVVAALAMTAGCKKTAPETTAPAGYVAVRDAKAGFAVAIPGDWIQIPLPQDIEIFDKKARDLQSKNANLGPAVIQARQLLQYGGKLFAVSPDGNSIVNVTADKTKEKTLAQIGQATTKSLQENGATDLAQEQTTTGAGPALKLTFKYPTQGKGDVTVVADEVQFYVLHSKKSWVITVISGAADIANTVAQTFKLR